MESLPDAAGPLGLVLLALVDSTSMGTLVIPVILLVVGQGGALRVAGRTLLYLAVIAVFYLLLGIALLAGLLPLLDSFGHLLAAPQVMLAAAVIGVLLVLWSFRLDPKAVAKRGGDPEASARRWTSRARRASGRPSLLISLALAAGLVEAASMIPYLAAMGILADMEVGLARGALILAGYCAVMILPGAVLCGVRALLGGRADAALDRVHDWAVKHVTSAFSWAVGIIGALIALQTVGPALAWLTGGGVS
ncbi:MAG: GAP family protein [Brachybacterium sp.]